MDAISFVLGVQTGQLRGGQLRDLIYAFDDREKEQRGRKAYVMLVYQLMDGTEISFTHSITPAGASEYRIGDLVVNWDDYNNSLKSLGILVKARNFLVFQIHAVDFARKTHDSLEKFTSKTLALSLKKEFDGVYGPAWHCIVGTSFGSFVTRSVGGFMYFSMDNKLHVLLFKTTVHKADDIHFLLIYTKFIYDLLNC